MDYMQKCSITVPQFYFLLFILKFVSQSKVKGLLYESPFFRPDGSVTEPLQEHFSHFKLLALM